MTGSKEGRNGQVRAPNGTHATNGNVANGGKKTNGQTPGMKPGHPAPRTPPRVKGQPPRGLGAPRTPPVGEERVYSGDQAEKLGPQHQRVFKWAPRCRVCGYAIRGTVEVVAPTEGPDRGSFAMACEHILCPSCRNPNQITPLTAWVVVAGPLPVAQA